VLELKIVTTVLCALGLYASGRMYRKGRLAAAGALSEPSVVQRPAAQTLRTPNSLLGLLYYAAFGGAIWFAGPLVARFLVVASAAAAALSLYLAYSLTFRTRMPCVLCWTGHIVNWALLAIAWRLFKFM